MHLHLHLPPLIVLCGLLTSVLARWVRSAWLPGKVWIC